MPMPALVVVQDEGDEDEGQDADDPSTRKAAADIDRLYGSHLILYHIIA